MNFWRKIQRLIDLYSMPNWQMPEKLNRCDIAKNIQDKV